MHYAEDMAEKHLSPAGRIWLGRFALLGVVTFFVTALALQFVRGDYPWFRTPLSFYLIGPYSGWLHLGYFALAAAIVLIAVGCYFSSIPAARSAATLITFGLGALGVTVTALSPTDVDGHVTRHGAVHLLAAALAFLATSVAMLLQSWRFRQDPGWRPYFHSAMSLAAVEFIWLWLYALLHTPINGAMQKCLILLILGWLAAVAWQLRRQHR